LYQQGKRDEAIAAHREAFRLKPHDVTIRNVIGNALIDQGKLDEAVATYRDGLRIKPNDPDAHNGLGAALYHQGKLAEAITEYREAIRIKPDYTIALHNLGGALNDQGKPAEAITEYREAIRIKPDYSDAHNNLGIALAIQGKLAEAVPAFREAVRLKPNNAVSRGNLGHALRIQHDFAAAAEEYRKARDLSKKDPNKAREYDLELANIERMASLAPRLPAVLLGGDRPKDAVERLGFANLAYDKNQFGPSARLYAEAFAADLKLAEDLSAGNRYNAACSAAMAGAGKGEAKPLPDEKEKARFRKQAVDWLKADLARRTEQARAGARQAKAEVLQRLLHWKGDSDLAGIREAASIKSLPEDEQKACRALWAELDLLLKKAQR
jgi:eukaryotic-like serine/threonine-protein kinase